MKRPRFWAIDYGRVFGQDGERTLLQCVSRGQEFVLETSHYPEATDWIRELLQDGQANG